LNFLEKTYFIFLVSPFSGNRDNEVRGAKKLYLCDVGLLNYLGKVSAGSIFENFVFNNIRKYGTVNYYQRYKGSEIDFIIDGRLAVEVKIKTSEFDMKRLKKTADSLNLTEHYIVTQKYSDLSRVILAQDL